MAVTDTIDGSSKVESESKLTEKTASLYRMAIGDHLCPSGLKSKSLLERKGYLVEDNLLKTREEVDAFKEAHGVATTPISFVNGEKIGGYTDLKKFFGQRVLGKNDTTYRPIIAIFASTALIAMAIAINLYDTFSVLTWLKWFFASSMVFLATQKLQDIDGFVNGFLGYDLIARRYVPYGYAYPFLELYVGIGMMFLIGTGSSHIWLVAPVGIFIGSIGAISVIKAVYIDKRELTCACVGGGSNVPLGFISLTENLVMVGVGIWMMIQQVLA